jgi:hypothetical protein
VAWLCKIFIPAWIYAFGRFTFIPASSGACFFGGAPVHWGAKGESFMKKLLISLAAFGLVAAAASTASAHPWHHHHHHHHHHMPH